MVKLAKKVGAVTRRESVVFLFFLVDGLIGFFHYRLFMNGSVGPVYIEPSTVLDICSFVFFIFMCVVPVKALRKTIVKNEDQLLK
tara:strand:+ start:211 stop:465 length:255 start_codon:yes stop_codon:yes gene_type:complete